MPAVVDKIKLLTGAQTSFHWSGRTDARVSFCDQLRPSNGERFNSNAVLREPPNFWRFNRKHPPVSGSAQWLWHKSSASVRLVSVRTCQEVLRDGWPAGHCEFHGGDWLHTPSTDNTVARRLASGADSHRPSIPAVVDRTNDETVRKRLPLLGDTDACECLFFCEPITRPGADSPGTLSSDLCSRPTGNTHLPPSGPAARSSAAESR